VLPLLTETELTTPVTDFPVESRPVTFRPIKLPAVATLCPKATDCNVVLKFWVDSIDPISDTCCISVVVSVGLVGSWFCKPVTIKLMKSLIFRLPNALAAVEFCVLDEFVVLVVLGVLPTGEVAISCSFQMTMLRLPFWLTAEVVGASTEVVDALERTALRFEPLDEFSDDWFWYCEAWPDMPPVPPPVSSTLNVSILMLC